MRSFTAILLLLCMLLQLAGPVGFLEARRVAIRHEMKAAVKQALPADRLTTFLIHPGEESLLEWEGSAEFRYEGRMYDLVRSTAHADGSVTYSCLSDDEETELNARLAQAVQRKMNEDAPASNPVQQMLLTFIASTALAIFPPTGARGFGYTTLPHPAGPMLLQDSPPPRLG